MGWSIGLIRRRLKVRVLLGLQNIILQLNWIERWFTTPKVEGSNPSRITNRISQLKWLEHRSFKPGVESSNLSGVTKSSWLNWIEHRFSKPRVTGSNPVEVTKGEQANIGLLRLIANEFYDSSEGSIPLLSAKKGLLR